MIWFFISAKVISKCCFFMFVFRELYFGSNVVILTLVRWCWSLFWFEFAASSFLIIGILQPTTLISSSSPTLYFLIEMLAVLFLVIALSCWDVATKFLPIRENIELFNQANIRSYITKNQPVFWVKSELVLYFKDIILYITL